MAIAALVLGVLAVIFVFIPGLNFIAPILAIVGIILAVMARKQEKSGAATAGLALSIVGLALGLLTWIVCVMCVAGVQKAINTPEFKKAFEQDEEQINEHEDDFVDPQRVIDEHKLNRENSTSTGGIL